MNSNNIGKSISVLTDIKNNKTWSGSAATTVCDQLDDIIELLDKEKNNIDKFKNVCDLLEKLKTIDNEISGLQNSFVDLTTVEPENLDNMTAKNANISRRINSLNTQRSEIRNNILTALSEFGILGDISVIDIPNVEGAKVLEKFDKGCIYELTTFDGKIYQAYIPYQVDPEKPIVLYDPGDGDNGQRNSYNNWKLFKDYFETNGYDQIVMRSFRYDNSSYYHDLCIKLDIDPPERLFVSHSGGTWHNMKEYVELLNEQGNKPGIVAIMDGWINVGHLNGNGGTEVLKNSDTVILGFYPNYENDYSSSYKTYAKTGVNMLLLKAKDDGFGLNHRDCNASLVEHGVLEFLNGNASLPDNYTITRYNPNFDSSKPAGPDNLQFIDVDYSDVSTIDDIYKYFNIDR